MFLFLMVLRVGPPNLWMDTGRDVNYVHSVTSRLSTSAITITVLATTIIINIITIILIPIISIITIIIPITTIAIMLDN